jgi:tellurium resistance protein TerZ
MPVDLVKGQRISLDKEAGGRLSRVIMGLGWDVAKRGGFLGGLFGGGGDSIDLDASCVMFDEAGRAVDTIYYAQLQSQDGSVIHTGDNLTGEGEGDDEQIRVDLNRVPPNVKTLVFVVNSFTGQDFGRIENAFCRLVDETTGAEIARYNLSGGGSHTAQVMAKVYRGSEGGWDMSAIGENASGRTFRDLMPAITASL